MAQAYKVYVVTDREFGERLTTLEQGLPVWVVDTPANKPVAQRLWRELPAGNHLVGITTVNDVPSASPSELFLAELDTIDLHQGASSADPPYTVIEVIGRQLTAKEALSTCGVDSFRERSDGFIATRGPNEERKHK